MVVVLERFKSERTHYLAVFGLGMAAGFAVFALMFGRMCHAW